jgi:hypothetical protein
VYRCSHLGTTRICRFAQDVFRDLLKSFGVRTMDDLLSLRVLKMADLAATQLNMVQKARFLRALGRLDASRSP